MRDVVSYSGFQMLVSQISFVKHNCISDLITTIMEKSLVVGTNLRA